MLFGYKLEGTYHQKDKALDMFPVAAERPLHHDNIPRSRCQVATFSTRQGQIPGCSWNCASVP